MIRHVSGLAEIVESVALSASFYREELGLEVEHSGGDPYAIVHVAGILHFGIWDRAFAAERLYGDASRADTVPLGFLLGFEVDDPATDMDRIGPAGTVVQSQQEEPWGQQTARFLTPGGALCEFTRTPWARQLVSGPEVAAPGTED